MIDKVDIILKTFDELEAEERRNFVVELCKRYHSLVCGELFRLNKCSLKEVKR